MDEPKAVVDSGAVQRPAPTASPPIDIEKLAEKVYQLMRAETRLERVRGNKRRTGHLSIAATELALLPLRGQQR